MAGKPKNNNNYLTLQQLLDIIEEQNVKIDNLKPQIWGFKREDLKHILSEILEKAKDKCRKNY